MNTDEKRCGTQAPGIMSDSSRCVKSAGHSGNHLAGSAHGYEWSDATPAFVPLSDEELAERDVAIIVGRYRILRTEYERVCSERDATQTRLRIIENAIRSGSASAYADAERAAKKEIATLRTR